LMPSFILSQRSTFSDIDNDGWLDAFVCNDTALSIPYRNEGSGIMIPDTNLIHTADRPGSYSAIWTDYDNDGDSDLYITKCQGGAPPGSINRTNLMYRNNGDGSYSEVGAQTGLDDNAQSWSTVFEDFDNDGDFDAFIINHDFQNRLFRNNGDGTFTDVINSSGIDGNDLGAEENASGDFNNDGFIDIFSGLKKEIYLGNGDLTFTGQDAPTKPGAIADLNDDGFLDVFHAGQLWINDANTNHWLNVFPIGITSNKNGIGARVEAYGAWGKQIREVRSGQSYSPMSSLIIHFGLGTHDKIDSLIIRWPSGVVSIMRELHVDSIYAVPEAPCIRPSINISILGTTSHCPGDTTLLMAPAGCATYVWSNNYFDQTLAVGDEGSFYVICIDSNGCASMSSTLEIKKVIEPTPVIFSPEGNTICEHDSLILYSSPGENYKWSTGETGNSSITIIESGFYTVSTDAICTSGQLTSAPFQTVVLESPPPIANGSVILQGDSILLMADGENCQWYDQPVGGNLLATGPFFQTLPLNSSATYFVESHFIHPGEIQTGGKSDTIGTGGLAGQAGYLLFETWAPFTLLSVTVYVPSDGPLGTRFVQLWSGDSLLAFKRFELHPGANVFDLNFNVPVGKFSLQCQQGNLWRNTGTLDYPYLIGDAGKITSSSFGDQYYYFFYDWKIKKEDFECISDRTAVDVILSASEEIEHQKELTIYPNPTAGLLNGEIKGNNQGIKLLRLLDIRGKEILTYNTGDESSFQLDLNHL
ncbi:MAG: FG-GAP-like repeat-containing protein, partial [Saprospiraceae bacterium]